MRITVSSLEDFLAVIKAKGPDSVFEKTIYVDLSHQIVNEHKYHVHLQFTTTLQRDGFEYLLFGAETCGRDILAQPIERTGSERADVLKDQLKRFADQFGLQLLPGIVSE